ncbi:MAG: NUDIX domain-containing protein [Acidobacteriota bacterium]|nr:MAG: NUDIX domain-containing protein [Acidobacteriota bacterium]
MSDFDAAGAEYFEVVDVSGNVIGKALRSECHGNPLLAHRAVHIFVRNAVGEYFLQKRSAAKDIQPGKWDTSVGGHLQPGESYEEAALRELEEELGVRLDPLEGLNRLSRRHDYIWRTAVETEHIRTFELEHEGPFRLQLEEIDAGAFWSLSDLREAVGQEVFTPNLEEELRLLGLLES